MSTSKNYVPMRTLLYTVNGETIRVIFEEAKSKNVYVETPAYNVKVEGVGNNQLINYPEPSFIFSEPCFLDGITLTEYKLFAADKEVKILNLVNIYKMTVLNDFANNRGFEQVHIPKSITRIEKSGFLESIKIISNTATIKEIGDNAFNSEYRIVKEISFKGYNGSKIESIGKNAFKGTKVNFSGIDRVLSMDELTYLGEGAFEGTTGIYAFNAIKLENIPNNAFLNASMSSLNLSKAFNFGEKAFTGLPLTTIMIGNMYEYNGNYAETYQLNINDINNLKIYVPSEETRHFLESEAAEGRPMFTDKFGNPIKHENIILRKWFDTKGKSKNKVLQALNGKDYSGLIDDEYLDFDLYPDICEAFIKNTSIIEVDLNIENLGKLHDKILSLVAATIRGNSTIQFVLDGIGKKCELKSLNLEGVKKTTTDKYFSVKNIPSLVELYLPNTLTKIEDGYGFTNLGIDILSLPSMLKKLGISSFTGNEKLKTVIFNDLITHLPERVFENCKVLELLIPSNIKSLGTEFMSGNEAMKKMFIPSTVTNISDNAFSNMKLVNLTFEKFNTINNVNTILSNCDDLKTIYLNTEEGSKLNLNSSIFDCECNVYVKQRLSYEQLIENTVNDIKPIYIFGEWFDVEGLTRLDYTFCNKIRDVGSVIFNVDYPIETFKGNELYLVNPKLEEFKNINKTNITKLTIENTTSIVFDLAHTQLPTTLEFLEIIGKIKNINLEKLNNLKYLGLNITEDNDFGKVLNDKNNLKIIEINHHSMFSSSKIEKLLELIVVVDSIETGDKFKNVIHVYEGNIKINYYNTYRKNFKTINNRSKYLDMERRINKSLNPSGLILFGAKEINPVIQTNLTDLSLFDSKLFDIDINNSILTNVYTHNIIETEFKFTTLPENHDPLSPNIKYLKLDKNINFTTENIKWSNFNAINRDVIILNHNSLQNLLRTTESNCLDVGNIETIEMLDLRFNSDNIYTLDNVNTLNWGIYGENINIDVPELTTFNYNYPTDIKDITNDIYARYKTLTVPKLSTFNYNNVHDITKPNFVLDMNNLEYLEYGEESTFNLLDDETFKLTLTSLKNLKHVRFGKLIKEFGNETLKNAEHLEEIYLDTIVNVIGDFKVEKASTGVNPDVKIYIVDDKIYDFLIKNPNYFIEGLKPENIILNIEIFDTKEHQSLVELLQVFETGQNGDVEYAGIDDKFKNLYKIVPTKPLSQKITLLRIYTDSSTSENYEKFMTETDLSNIKNIKISGQNVVVCGIGGNPVHATNITSVDLSRAELNNNELTENAFYNCNNLKQVILNKSAERIRANAFYNCENIELIENVDMFPDTYTTKNKTNDDIKNNFINPIYDTYICFDDTEGKIVELGLDISKLSPQYTELKIKLNDSNGSILLKLQPSVKELTLYGNISKLPLVTSESKDSSLFDISTLTINTDIDFKIREDEFRNKTSFIGIFGNEYLTEIGNNAFNATGIKSIALSNIKIIGDGAFANCFDLIGINIDGLISIGNNVFYNCDKLISVELGEINIPSGMFTRCNSIIEVKTKCKEIGSFAFKDTNLSVLNAPNLEIVREYAFYGTAFTEFENSNIKILENHVFDNCELLTSVKCENCDSVGDECFIDCSKLKIIKLSSSKSKIGQGCFKNCKNLTNINITGITEIPKSCFENCLNLENVDGINDIIKISTYGFKGCEKLKINNTSVCKLDNVIELEKEAFAETTFTDFIFEKLEKIDKDVFKGCKTVVSIEMPLLNEFKETVGESVGYFEDLPLKTLNSGKAPLTESIFNNCIGITTLITELETFDNLKYIVKTLLSLIIFEAPNLINIPISSFELSNIEEVNCPSVIEIGSKDAKYPIGTFQKCKYLKSIILSNCESIGKSEFYECISLTDVIFKNCKYVGDKAFYGCESLKSVVLSNICDYIGSAAFKNCIKLTSAETYLTEYVEDETFDGCESLKNVVLGSNLKGIKTAAFRNTAITEIDIPNSYFEIGESAFENSQLNNIINSENISVLNVGGNNFLNTQIIVFINSKITHLPMAAFGNCQKLETLSLSNCVKNECNFSTCENLVDLAFLDLDLASGVNNFDNIQKSTECKIHVLRNFINPPSTVVQTNYDGVVYYIPTATGLENAKIIMKNSTFIEDTTSRYGVVVIYKDIEIFENSLNRCVDKVIILPQLTTLQSENFNYCMATEILFMPNINNFNGKCSNPVSNCSIVVKNPLEINRYFGEDSNNYIQMYTVIKSPYVSESGDIYYRAAGYYNASDTVNTEEYENENKSNLNYLYISDTYTKIEGSSFTNCSNLVLVYAAGVKSISTKSFAGCEKLKYFIVNIECTSLPTLPRDCKIIKVNI